MGSIKWIYNEGVFSPQSGEMEITGKLEPGIYNLVVIGGMMKRIALRPMYEKFEFPYKIYDLGIGKDIERILETWSHLGTDLPNKTLGVLFHGTKGTGKTIAGKLLSNSVGVPVICISECFPGLEDFLSLIDFDCILFIDEMEKTFAGDSAQVILRILDGVYQGGRKLCIMTTNTLKINDNLLGRPGRIRYKRSFEDLPEKLVKDYISDNLKNQDLAPDVMDLVNSLEISTIDILKTIVEEINIHGHLGEDDIKFLNIPRKDYTFEVLACWGSPNSESALRMTLKDFQSFVGKRIKNYTTWVDYISDGGFRSASRKEKEGIVRCLEIFNNEENPKTGTLLSSGSSIVPVPAVSPDDSDDDDDDSIPHTVEELDALSNEKFRYYAYDGIDHRFLRLPMRVLKVGDIIMEGHSYGTERVLYSSDDGYVITEITDCGSKTGIKMFYKILNVNMLGGLYSKIL
jgi:hypothetical protein